MPHPNPFRDSLRSSQEPEPEPEPEPVVPVEEPVALVIPDTDRPYAGPRDVQPLQRGRFVLTCVSGEGVKGKDSSLQAYLKVKIGDAAIADAKAKAHKTKTTKAAKAGGKLEFNNEKINIDIQDPTTVTDKDGVVFLEVALYDDNWMADKCVCVAKVDVTDILSRPNFYNDGPKVLEVDLHKPGTTEDCGTLKLKVEFWAAKFGVVKVICNDCTDLNDTSNMLDKQDPYVYLSLGEEKARTETLSNAGSKPDWKGVELLVFVDERNWNKPFKLQIYDDDFGSDALIAEHNLDLFNMMAEKSAAYSSIPLTTKSGKDAGFFNCNCDFLPFGQLNVIVHSAKSLRNPDSWGKPDPYLTLSLDQCQPAALKALPTPVDPKSKEVKKIVKDAKKQTGDCAKLASVVKQTQTIDGSLNPEWLAELSFDYVDATTLSIACYDEDVGSDDLIGTAEIDLTEVLQLGKWESWVSLNYSSKKGTVPAGDVKIQIYFWGQPNTPFPHRPGPSTKVFTDAERQWGAGTFFPPAKAPFDVHDSGKYLAAPGVMDSTGVIQVEVVEGIGIKGKDSKLFAYVRAKVGRKGKVRQSSQRNRKRRKLLMLVLPYKTRPLLNHHDNAHSSFQPFSPFASLIAVQEDQERQMQVF